MKAKIVRFVDVGFHEDFTAYVEFMTNMLDSRDRRSDQGAEVEIVRSRVLGLIDHALTAKAHVIHLTGHGEASADDVVLFTDDETTEYSLVEAVGEFQDKSTPIGAQVILIDACFGASARFQRVLRGCIERETLLIGSGRSIDWRESTTWAATFYSAYLRAKGKGATPIDWAIEAVGRADKAYEILTDRNTPYRSIVLSPNRAAQNAFG